VCSPLEVNRCFGGTYGFHLHGRRISQGRNQRGAGRLDTVACKAVSKQWLGEHIPAATDTHAIIEVLLETVFSTRSVQRGYKEDN
jgi:hypothetical protein